MTAWQDQPPQSNKPLSRRQVRQNERGDATGAVVDLPAEPAAQSDFSSFAREGWDTEARRIAAATPLNSQQMPQQQPAQQPSSRRSQRSLQAVDPNQGAAEPLEYLTQARPQAQSPDGQQLRRRSAPAVDQPGIAPQTAFVPQPAQPLPFEQQPSYRVRDFSPEGRPSFSSTTPETSERAVPENLQYRTQGTPPPAAPVTAPPAAYVPPVQPVESAVEERTFSRRELRAMEAAKNPVPEATVDQAPIEQPLVRDRTRSAAVEPEQQSYSQQQPYAEQSSAPQQYNPPQFPPFAEQAAQPAVDQPVSPFEELGFVEPSTWTPPTGHWSTQALIDDDEQVQENTLSRNVGATSGAITTSALVLPSLPADSLTRPLGSTGEILVTGTIDLPRSLGSTGAHPGRYDHSDVDAFLEAGDREDSESNPDSAPVRAIRAVSTHTSTRGVMEAKKPRGNSRLPLILGVAATVMAVGVVVLVVCALVFGVFSH
ncbi:MAG: hypothetical protein JWN80_1723 [Microbacteriaceae bacterium]|jgi:hypothetical protein|nr:hypothetical protein [Microbacteriaceae bacterium]